MASPTGNQTLFRTTLVATGMQVAMVVVGHFVPAVALWFGPGGMAISLLAGLGLAWAEGSQGARAATRGALTGGLCALIGIAVSFALADVTAPLLVLGTLASAAAGAVGGLAARVVRRRVPDRPQVA